VSAGRECVCNASVCLQSECASAIRVCFCRAILCLQGECVSSMRACVSRTSVRLQCEYVSAGRVFVCRASVRLQIQVLYDVTPFRLLNGYRRFGELQCLQLRTSVGPNVYKNLGLCMWLCIFLACSFGRFGQYYYIFEVPIMLGPDDEGNTILRNVGNRYPTDRMSHSKCCDNLKPRNYLRLAQCYITEEANLHERL